MLMQGEMRRVLRRRRSLSDGIGGALGRRQESNTELSAPKLCEPLRLQLDRSP